MAQMPATTKVLQMPATELLLKCTPQQARLKRSHMQQVKLHIWFARLVTELKAKAIRRSMHPHWRDNKTGILSAS